MPPAHATTVAARAIDAVQIMPDGAPQAAPPQLVAVHSGVASDSVAQAAAPVQTPAWNALMRKHGRRVIVSLVARGIPIERARELSQEAWMRIVAQHRAGRLQRLEMPGIVVAQANFLAQDEHRLRKRRARMGLSSTPPVRSEVVDLAHAMTGPDLERRIAARQALRRVLALVDQSYPNARRVFGLLYGAEPRTPAEVAEQTGLSVQRVRQILCELRKSIRAELETGDSP